MSLRITDEINVAPTNIQEVLNIHNSGWCFAVCNGNSGIVPINHLKFLKKVKTDSAVRTENNNEVKFSDLMKKYTMRARNEKE